MIRVAFRHLGLRHGTFYLLRYAWLRFRRWHASFMGWGA